MLERILDFLKNKYFIGGSIFFVLVLAGSAAVNYYNEKANEVEFKKFIEINEEFSLEELDSNDLMSKLDLNFDSFGYEIITKTILAKKALDEQNFDLALNLFMQVHDLIASKNINKETKNILNEHYVENILRIYMEKNDLDGGAGFLNDNAIDSLRFHELAGDFYKFFEKNDDSIFHYNKALTFELDEAQKNIINLKKPKEE